MASNRGPVLLPKLLKRCFASTAANSSSVPTVPFLLEKIRTRDPLPLPDPHIEHLVLGNAGTTRKGNDGINGFVDFSYKTRMILQSSHPIRHVVEREVINLQNQSTFVSYHNWVTIFGRCLDVKTPTSKDKELFETNLNHISNAAEVGMLSSKVHEIVLNLPPPSDRTGNNDKWDQFLMGNKYAVLVGDYFAVKTVYYTQKTKVNKVFLCITRGIEDFASVSFFSNLIHRDIWYPIVPAPGTRPIDWSNYAAKVSGYFTGALHAVLTVSKNDSHSNPDFLRLMNEFCTNFGMALKLLNELDQLRTTPGPQICISLPAIIHHQQNPVCFDKIKEKSLLLTDEDIKRVQEELLRNSAAIEQANQLALEYASKTKELIKTLGVDAFYLQVFQQLMDATVNNVVQRS